MQFYIKLKADEILEYSKIFYSKTNDNNPTSYGIFNKSKSYLFYKFDHISGLVVISDDTDTLYANKAVYLILEYNPFKNNSDILPRDETFFIGTYEFLIKNLDLTHFLKKNTVHSES